MSSLIPVAPANANTSDVVPQPLRILLVDDSKAFLSAAQSFLESRRLCVVGCAGSGPECLIAVPALEPDLVLMDIHMPGMNGLETAKALKRAHPAVRVVLMSLDGEWLQRQETADGRVADGFISKIGFAETCTSVIDTLFPRLSPPPQGFPDLA